MYLIDVSHNNGKIDWTKVKNALIKNPKNEDVNIDGTIIRAGYGKILKQKDREFDNNYEGAVKAGLHLGTYWYSYALTAAEAELEARVFLECIKGKTFDLPIFLDIEEDKQKALGKKVCTDIVNSFMNILEAAGYFSGVYSFDSFFQSNLDESIRKRYAIWTARVENVDPKCAPEWGIHQYSWKGKVNGIKGDTDLDNCKIDYPAIIKKAGLNGFTKNQ